MLLFVGCGGSEFEPGTGSLDLATAANGRAQLSVFGSDVIAAIDALSSEESTLIYTQVGRWNNQNIALTGSVEDAYQAAVAVISERDLGARGLYSILNRLQPSSGQGFMVTFGGTLTSGIETSKARVLDAYTALLSETNVVARNVEPIIASNLPSVVTSMAEFHGLRILNPTYLPPDLREAMLGIRALVPNAQAGESIQKIIMLSDLQNYLDGAFDPEVGGFTALRDQTEFLTTPAQYIAGLRLDYPGGFQGETQVGLWSSLKTTLLS